MKIPFTDHHILIFLKKFEKSSLPLDQALQLYFRGHKSLGAKDRKTIGNTLFGMMRFRSLLQLVSPSLEQQLDFYRDLERKKFSISSPFPKWARLGVSEFLYHRLLKAYGEKETEKLCRLFNEQAPTTIRANPLKISRDALFALWKEKFSLSPCLHAPHGLHLHRREALFALPEFKQGMFEVQDEGSQLVAEQVRAKPNDLVLDYCAGSGGKTLAFAPRMEGKGQIYLHDIRSTVLLQARQRLKRAGIQNAQCLPPNHPQLAHLKGKCDWVLIDVPCSGTGTLRRNPDQKWRLDEAMLQRLVEEQRAIALSAISYLHPKKGRLVYATCSLLPEENGTQVDFLQSHLSLVEPPLSLMPQPQGMDGFFVAVFRKKDLCYNPNPR